MYSQHDRRYRPDLVGEWQTFHQKNPEVYEMFKRYTMEKFYNLSKMIVHRQLQIVKGKDYELYYKEAEEFIEVMRRLIEKKF